MVYWSLYMFILDFLSWTASNENTSVRFFISFLINGPLWYNIKGHINRLILYIFSYFKEIKVLDFLMEIHNQGTSVNTPFKRANFYLGTLKHYDHLGRNYISLDLDASKAISYLSLFLESFKILGALSFQYYKSQKKMNYFLYNVKPNFLFFSDYGTLIIEKKSRNALNYSSNLVGLRSLTKDLFNLNQFRHSGLFEAVWAAFPSFIIISILIPSLVLLYSFEDILNPKLSIKVIANQWYWTYEFNNYVKMNSIDTNSSTLADLQENNIIEDRVNIVYAFNSNILGLDSLESGEKRLLEVDNRLVLPTNTTLRFLVTSSDVLHSFASPELGFKIDANPGRLNQILVYINRPGIYYGQCSELCGPSHGFMPIVIQAVLPSDFQKYLNSIVSSQ